MANLVEIRKEILLIFLTAIFGVLGGVFLMWLKGEGPFISGRHIYDFEVTTADVDDAGTDGVVSLFITDVVGQRAIFNFDGGKGSDRILERGTRTPYRGMDGPQLQEFSDIEAILTAKGDKPGWALGSIEVRNITLGTAFCLRLSQARVQKSQYLGGDPTASLKDGELVVSDGTCN
jgi:hypothetical protein